MFSYLKRHYFLSVLFLVLGLVGLLFIQGSASDLKGKKVRPYLSSGLWYPSTYQELSRSLEGYFSKAQLKPQPGEIIGLIAPHAGHAYSGQCAANAYKQLEKRPDIERVFLFGIAHRGDFYGAAVGDFDFDSTPLGEIPIDKEVCAKLAKEKYFTLNSQAFLSEHSIETHLPFLQFIEEKIKNRKYKIIPILFCYLEPKDFKAVAQSIKKYITPKTLLIASSDFTHYGENYGYVPFKGNIKDNLTKLDMGMVDQIKSFNFKNYCNYKEKTGITMCGFIPVGILMNLLDETGGGYTATLTDYYKSGDMTGDYSLCVSYVSMVFSKQGGFPSIPTRGAPPELPAMSSDETDKPISEPAKDSKKLTSEEKKTLLLLARNTLENYFVTLQANPLPEDQVAKKYHLSPILKEKAGVFVTLREKGELRGCIGSIIGVMPLWEGVQTNALHAALRDPRFSSLSKKELKIVDIEISVMTPLQQITDYKKIRLGTDGVYIKYENRSAIFLPQVATEAGFNLDQFLGNLCLKAGLNYSQYKLPGMEFYIFQAQVFGEKEELK